METIAIELTPFLPITLGIKFIEGAFHNLWSCLQTPQGEFYQCVSYLEVINYPNPTWYRPEFYQNNKMLYRNLYNLGIFVICIDCGVFTPEAFRLVKLYGTIGYGNTLPDAEKMLVRNIKNMETALDSFINARTIPPDWHRIEWYLRLALNSNKLATNTKTLLLPFGYPQPIIDEHTPRDFWEIDVSNPLYLRSFYEGCYLCKIIWIPPYHFPDIQAEQGICLPKSFEDELIQQELSLKKRQSIMQRLYDLRQDFAFVLLAAPVSKYILHQYMIQSAEAKSMFKSVYRNERNAHLRDILGNLFIQD